MARFDKLEARFDKLKAKVAANRGAILRLQDRLAGIDDRLDRIETNVSWIRNRLENVEELTLKTAVRGGTDELSAVRRQKLAERQTRP